MNLLKQVPINIPTKATRVKEIKNIQSIPFPCPILELARSPKKPTRDLAAIISGDN